MTYFQFVLALIKCLLLLTSGLISILLLLLLLLYRLWYLVIRLHLQGHGMVAHRVSLLHATGVTLTDLAYLLVLLLLLLGASDATRVGVTERELLVV